MSKRQSIAVAAVLALILGIVSITALKNAQPGAAITIREPTAALPVVAPTETEPSKPEVVVHIAGAVKRPGVYHLRPGARNDDAVRSAGGLTAGANAASVNLAARAVDGTQLYVKNQKEQPVGGAADEIAGPVDARGKGANPTAARRSMVAVAGAAGRAGAARPAKLKSPSEGRININTASADDLQRITGIGPSMAEKIIAYRAENHGFQSVEDLMQVSGVGAKKYAKWSPFIRIH